MEEIFKSLSESVSEQCYDEIMGLVEAMLKDRMTVGQLYGKTGNAVKQREQVYLNNKKKYGEGHKKTFNSKLRLNYATNLEKGLSKYIPNPQKTVNPPSEAQNVPISQAKEKARKSDEFHYYSPVQAVGSIGNGIKPNGATGYKEENNNRRYHEYRDRMKAEINDKDDKYDKEIE